MEVESPKLDLTKRYLCADLGHIARGMICSKGPNGFAKADTARLDLLKAAGKEVVHTWISVVEWRTDPVIMDAILSKVRWNEAVDPVKPKSVEELREPATSKPADMQYVDTDLRVDPKRQYCQLYDHVQQQQDCAMRGYEHLPKDETHGYHEAASFKKGKRSPYVRFTSEIWRCNNPGHKGQSCSRDFWEKSELKNFLDPTHRWTNTRFTLAAAEHEDDGRVTTGEYLNEKKSYAQRVAESIVGTEDIVEQVAEALTKPENAEMLEKVTNDPVEFQDPEPSQPELLTRGLYAGTVPNSRYVIKDESWVQVRAQVLFSGAPSAGKDFYELRFQRPDGTFQVIPVASSDIICVTESPLPEEPASTTILISLKEGDWIFWYGQEKWRLSGTDDAYDWETIWRAYGPFEEYRPSRRIT